MDELASCEMRYAHILSYIGPASLCCDGLKEQGCVDLVCPRGRVHAI